MRNLPRLWLLTCNSFTYKRAENPRSRSWGLPMKRFLVGSSFRLHRDEEGQGLVEYMLILALVSFAGAAGMKVLASGLNSAFSDIGSIVNAYIT